jgi:flagellar hook protein FlgE
LIDIQLELTTPDPTPDDPEPVARLLSPPRASTRLTSISNIDARSQDHSTSGLFNNWDATNTVPISQNDYELRAEQDIYDSSGDRHSIQVYYDKASQDNVWEYLVTSPPEGTGAATTDGVLARGSITFSSNGYITGMSLENYQGGAWTPGAFSDDGFPILRTPFGGAESIELDMGVTYVNGAWQNEGQSTTQFGYGSFTVFSDTDGYGEGDVLDFSISTDGIIRANFDNGVISDLYRVALSDFINPYGIRRMGSSLYQADPSGSGNLITGSPGSSGLGMITGSSLERSNVDLTEQFGELIFTQRAYQANAKGIIAADEMLKTLIALKR